MRIWVGPIRKSIIASDIEENTRSKEHNNQRTRVKSVDFVLVHERDDERNVELYDKFDNFIVNLEQKGFELEVATFSVNENIIFIKIHAPKKVLLHFAEIFGIELAFQNIRFKPKPTTPYKFMATDLTRPNNQSRNYRRAKGTISAAKPRHITTAEKGLIVYKVLSKNAFGDEKEEYGIERLIHKQVFESAFPIHDGSFEWTEDGPLNDRQLLVKFWSSLKCWYKQQPLDLIEKYYGSDIAFYFAWLGFYNRMLIPASIAGFLCFIIGAIAFASSFKLRNQEVCDSDKFLCPRCLVENCKYELLKNSCLHAHMIHLFDNPIVIAFAALMSIWSTLFLELWRREEAMLQMRWNLQSVETDYSMRPEFEERTMHRRISTITGQSEPYVPQHILCYRYTITGTVILFLILLMLLGIFGVMIYVKTISVILTKTSTDKIVSKNVGMIASSTGSIISVIFILLFELLYDKVAMWLTNLENPRTQKDFYNSYTYKCYAMAFVNNYAVVFYIAFIKARFYTYPGDEKLWTEMGGIGSDLCEPAGCIIGLGMQMVIILLAKNVIMTTRQYFVPQILILVNKFRKTKTTRHLNITAQWECDYLLNIVFKYHLKDEYMQMVIQYGFVTFFVAAFPLAPLLALINNVIELRVDACKLTKRLRRPIAFKAANLGAWNGILQAITYIGVATNAFVITFTSEFVPRAIYRTTIDSSLRGFVNSTLSVYNVSELPETFHSSLNITICYYPGKRYPPDHSKRYQLTDEYWYELTMKFLGVLVFEHIVMSLTGIIAYAIPNISLSVKEHINYQKIQFNKMHLRSFTKNYAEKQQEEQPDLFVDTL